MQIPKAPRWSCRVLSTRWDISCQHIILQEFSNPSPGINHSFANAATSRLPHALLRQCFVTEQPSFKPRFPVWKSCKQCWNHMHEHLQLSLLTATAKLPPWAQGGEQPKSCCLWWAARDNPSPTLVALQTVASPKNPLTTSPLSSSVSYRVPGKLKCCWKQSVASLSSSSRKQHKPKQTHFFCFYLIF